MTSSDVHRVFASIQITTTVMNNAYVVIGSKMGKKTVQMDPMRVRLYSYIFELSFCISLILATFLWSFAGPPNNICHTVGNKPCQFPFRYNGVSYSTCTLDAADDPSVPWCSTLVDDNGNHVSGGGHYGDCGPKCPFPGRSTFLSAKLK